MKLIIDNFEINNLGNHGKSYYKLLNGDLVERYYYQLIMKLPCNLNSVEKDDKYKLFKFKFLHLLENQFELVKYENEYQQFISASTSTEIKMKILNELYSVIINSEDYKKLTIDTLFEYFEYDEIDYGSNIVKNFQIKNIVQSNILSNLYKLDEYQQLFKNLFIQQQEQQEQNQCSIINNQIQHHCNYNELEDNIFLVAFRKGDIELCELFLSLYPNYNFKISKQSITDIIENGGDIHIIFYFLKNNRGLFTSTNGDEDADVINHLKSILNNHKYYKYFKYLNLDI